MIVNFREKLQLEIAARERAEKKQQEYEDRLRQMQEEMERSQANLLEAQEMIRRLEEQLRQLQAAKEELEQRQNELQAMMQRLEETKVLNHRLETYGLVFRSKLCLITVDSLTVVN